MVDSPELAVERANLIDLDCDMMLGGGRSKRRPYEEKCDGEDDGERRNRRRYLWRVGGSGLLICIRVHAYIVIGVGDQNRTGGNCRVFSVLEQPEST